MSDSLKDELGAVIYPSQRFYQQRNAYDQAQPRNYWGDKAKEWVAQKVHGVKDFAQKHAERLGLSDAERFYYDNGQEIDTPKNPYEKAKLAAEIADLERELRGEPEVRWFDTVSKFQPLGIKSDVPERVYAGLYKDKGDNQMIKETKDWGNGVKTERYYDADKNWKGSTIQTGVRVNNVKPGQSESASVEQVQKTNDSPNAAFKPTDKLNGAETTFKPLPLNQHQIGWMKTLWNSPADTAYKYHNAILRFKRDNNLDDSAESWARVKQEFGLDDSGTSVDYPQATGFKYLQEAPYYGDFEEYEY